MAMDPDHQQYCLRWNNHLSNLLGVFSRLLESELLTDVLLAAEGSTIRAHKVVLSACSTYFESLFTTFSEKNQIVILKDTSFADMAACIEFMYKGEVNVPQDRLPSLLKTADSLKVRGLTDISKTSMTPFPTSSSSLSFENNMDGVSTTKDKASFPEPIVSLRSESESPVQNVGGSKRKRGRPRILDSPIDMIKTDDEKHEVGSSTSKTSTSSNNIKDFARNSPIADMNSENYSDMDGDMIMEKLESMNIVKMKDYLAFGTRQQYWEEPYVKLVLEAVKCKKIDMKTGADRLGVSYGTLYGRYRECYGYLRHSWNPSLSSASGQHLPSSSDFMNKRGDDEDENNFSFDQIVRNSVALKHALDPALLAYHLPFKMFRPDAAVPPPLVNESRNKNNRSRHSENDNRGADGNANT